MNVSSLDGGFDNRETDAAFAFRSLLNVMAKPGTIQSISGGAAPAPLSKAASTLLLTLCDADTPIYLAGKYANSAIKEWIAFHIGAPLCERKDAQFAVGTLDELLPLSDYPIGTAEYPDRSSTMIVEVEGLENLGATLSGPGIKNTAQLSLPGELILYQNNNAHFPLGLDFLFTSGSQVAALPRSTKVR